MRSLNLSTVPSHVNYLLPIVYYLIVKLIYSVINILIHVTRGNHSDVKAGDTTIKERLRGIANTFQNCSEVSAQEVSYHLLSLPLSKCSRANVYINTSPADKRVRNLKSKPILQGMPHDSEAILQPGLIEHYIQRPDQLENVSLAEFAAMYDFQSNTKVLKINPEFEDGNSDQEDIPLLDNPSLFPLKDSGYMSFVVNRKLFAFVGIILYRTKLTFTENS